MSLWDIIYTDVRPDGDVALLVDVLHLLHHQSALAPLLGLVLHLRLDLGEHLVGLRVLGRLAHVLHRGGGGRLGYSSFVNSLLCCR